VLDFWGAGPGSSSLELARQVEAAAGFLALEASPSYGEAARRGGGRSAAWPRLEVAAMTSALIHPAAGGLLPCLGAAGWAEFCRRLSPASTARTRHLETGGHWVLFHEYVHWSTFAGSTPRGDAGIFPPPPGPFSGARRPGPVFRAAGGRSRC